MALDSPGPALAVRLRSKLTSLLSRDAWWSSTAIVFVQSWLGGPIREQVDDVEHWVWGLLITAYVLVIILAVLAI